MNHKPESLLEGMRRYQKKLDRETSREVWDTYIKRLRIVQKVMGEKGIFRVGINLQRGYSPGEPPVTGDVSQDLRFIPSDSTFSNRREFHLDDLTDISELILSEPIRDLSSVSAQDIREIKYSVRCGFVGSIYAEAW